MGNIPTTNHGLLKPEYTDTRWDVPNNSNLDAIDAILPPTGGDAGQVLAKASAADNDTEWVDGGGGGGAGLPTVIPEAIMHGNIYGGNFELDIVGGFTMSPVSCIANDGVTPLISNTGITGTFQYSGSCLNFFLVKRASSGLIEVDFSFNSNGSDITDVEALRWVFFCPYPEEPVKCIHNGDWLSFANASPMQITTDITDTWRTLNHTTLIPVDRIEAIQYGAYWSPGTQSAVGTSNPGLGLDWQGYESVIGDPPATLVGSSNPEQWGINTSQSSLMLPFSGAREFRSIDAGATSRISIRAVKMKR